MPFLRLLPFFALGWTVIVAVHRSEVRCRIYLPAHFPVLFAGLVGGPLAGLLTVAGAIAGELSGEGPRGWLLLSIGAELAVYGGVAGILAQGATSWLALLSALGAAMLGGRLVYLLISRLGRRVAAGALARDLFVTPWPGMAIQLGLLPVLAGWVRAA